MLALIVQTARSAPKELDVPGLRAHISERLRRFTEGRHVLKGLIHAGDARSITTTLLQNAAAREMESRGYVRSDRPDLVINFHGRLAERVDIQSRPAPSMGPTWGYRGWAGSPWGGWGGTEVTTRRYNVGTLVIDLVDLERRQMVFQGSAQGTVTRQMQQNREQ